MGFPFYKQLDGMDCGPTCLCMLARFYGKTYSIQELRDKSFIVKSGVNLLGLSDASKSIGLDAICVRATVDKLINDVKLPCILHWKNDHFVVLYKIKRGKFYIADPSHGLLKYSELEFRRLWLNTRIGDIQEGVCMIIAPTPTFYKLHPERKAHFSFLYLYQYLKPYKKYIRQLIISLLLGSILQLVFPFLTQAIVDRGVNLKNINIIKLILVAQTMLVLSRSSVEIIRRWILLHISARINIGLISNFLSKLMKLPMNFFESKLIGDLIRRIEDHSRIDVFLTQSLLSILFSSMTIIVFSIALAIYDGRIFSIFILFSLVYVLWILLFMKRRADLDHKNFTQMASNQNNIIQLIHGMQEIKLTGCEDQKREEWEVTQVELFNLRVKTLTLGQWQQIGSTIINEVRNITITYLSATAVVSESISLGAMLSIQYIIGQMQGPVEQLIMFLQQTQDAKLSMERLSEIYDKQDEEQIDENNISYTNKCSSINIQNISFTYGSYRSRRVINNLSLNIPAGKRTAIVGLSGSGKTTLIKLLLGFYPPTEGQIYIGDTALDNIKFKDWRKLCGAVMQEGYIFNDTIAKNIAPGVNNINQERLIYAAKMANILDYINSTPLKFDTMIGAAGQGLSQGQKQRILTARIIYKDPQYIFFDEATNALDANNEKIIMRNLDLFFKDKTVVIVAHRLSTVKNADQIIVLKEGEILEQGTHVALVDQKGAYYELIRNQLELDK